MGDLGVSDGGQGVTLDRLSLGVRESREPLTWFPAPSKAHLASPAPNSPLEV